MSISTSPSAKPLKIRSLSEGVKKRERLSTLTANLPSRSLKVL
jgi:hypothetical protein